MEERGEMGTLSSQGRFRTVGVVRTLVLVVAAVGLLSVAGAGLAGNSKTAAAQAMPDLAYVKAQVEMHKAIPTFAGPTGSVPFDASKLKGKRVFSIPTASQIPLFVAITAGQVEAIKPYGIKYFEFENKGAPSDWAKGIEQAISQKYDVILLEGPFVSQLKPQIARANAAGIPVISAFSQDANEPLQAGVAGWVFFPFTATAKLEADWVIMDSQGKANVLVVTSKDFTPTANIVKTLTSEFATRCGPTCTVKFVDVPGSQWAQKLQSAVQSALIADQKINYIIPIYDSMSQFAVPAIKAVGAQKKIKIATFNGTPFVLDLIRNGDVVAMDAAEDNRCAGWANMDNVMRAMAGIKTVNNGSDPIRVFDASNVKEAGVPATYAKGWGNSCQTYYRRIWSGK